MLSQALPLDVGSPGVKTVRQGLQKFFTLSMARQRRTLDKFYLEYYVLPYSLKAWVKK
jgi:hypothetical protein